MMAGSSSSSGYSTSSSHPTVIQTPQSEWALQLSQLLGALSQNQYSWAMQQFNNGMGVTNDQINNYMNLAGMGAGLAQNLLGRYESTFEPLMNNFIQQAGSYNSADRQKFMMGQAESTAAQSDKAALDGAARNLQAFGINPNSGRYQDLITSARMQDAATRAGAGTQASVNTAQIGRQMQQQAVQMGQNLPGMTVNALQSAYTGVTGAVNAENAMLNTGANLTNTAANFGNAAANANKLPPVGQNSNSNAKNASSSQQQDPNKQQQQKPPANSNGGQRGAGNGGQGNNGNMGNGGDNSVTKHVDDGSGNGNPDYATAGGLGLGNVNPNDMPSWLNNPTLNDHPFDPGQPGQATSPDNTNWAPPNADPNSGQILPPGTGQGPGTNPAGVQGNDFFQPTPNSGDPFATAPSGTGVGGGPNSFQGQYQPGMFPGGGDQQAWDPNAGGDVTGSVTNNFDPGQPFDASQFNNWDQGQGQGQYQPPDQGQGQGQGQYQQPQGGDYQPPQQDYQDPNQMDQNGAYSSGPSYSPQPDYSSQSGGGGGYYGSYARGGRVRGQRGVLPTTGGQVPRSASPSRGRVTDDIPARLNAGEFVIPRDVTAHMGTKHFQDVIKKSRQMRTGMSGPPARPKQKPALRMRPTFTSQTMGAR